MDDITNTSDGTSGDFLTVLSSELIAEVMEEYFNRKMYRQKVKVVDLQPQGSGYAFSLAFVKDIPRMSPSADDFVNRTIPPCPHGIPYNPRGGHSCPQCYHDHMVMTGVITSDSPITQDTLATATNVDYTVPQRCQHGLIIREDDPCLQCQMDILMRTGGMSNNRDTKGKFTKKAKVQ